MANPTITTENAEDIYLAHIAQPYGRRYAATVGRFQEGFLADRVTNDVDVAFARAVDAAERLLPVLRIAAAR